ncbi:MAG: hypothetical protein GXY83_19260 [Rhodopirellula sp.]|nr:hypothetical protein [Rhodopirellula sp.]
MTITIHLNHDEIAQIKELTRLDDEVEAVSKAAREYLRMARLRELKAASGRIDFEENWKDLESLELGEVEFPH